jgi:uncharacterized protein (TIGR02246 family)
MRTVAAMSAIVVATAAITVCAQVAVLEAAITSYGQSANTTDGELLEVVKALADAQRTFDQSAMTRLLTDDYVEVSPIGDVDLRAEVLGFYTPEARAKAPQLRSVQIDEPHLRVYGDQAMVIVRQTMNVETGDSTRAVVMRVSLHLRKVDGRWRISSAQFTPIPPPRKAG